MQKAKNMDHGDLDLEEGLEGLNLKQILSQDVFITEPHVAMKYSCLFGWLLCAVINFLIYWGLFAISKAVITPLSSM